VKKRILVVEDEYISQLHLEMLLEMNGFSVHGLADTGECALAMFREPWPDLVLIDIFLRGELDGIQVIGKMQEIHPVPFVFLTASTDEGTYSRAQSVNPDGFIKKPFREEELVSTLCKLSGIETT